MIQLLGLGFLWSQMREHQPSRGRVSARLTTSRLPTHTCQGIAGRGDEPELCSRQKCWRVKRGAQPASWTKALRAEARRFPVNLQWPGAWKDRGSRRGVGVEAQKLSLSCSPLGGEAEAASFSPGTMTEDAPGTPDPGLPLQPASSSATGPWHAPEHQRPQKHPHFTLSTQDSVSSQYHLIFKSCRSKTYYILP